MIRVIRVLFFIPIRIRDSSNKVAKTMSVMIIMRNYQIYLNNL